MPKVQVGGGGVPAWAGGVAAKRCCKLHGELDTAALTSIYRET